MKSGIFECVKLLQMEQRHLFGSAAKSTHPYSNLQDQAFWDRAVAGTPPFAVDPVLDVPFAISRTDRVATAGSCFAQQIARALQTNSFHYFVTEPAPDHLAPDAAASYGTFSARYGNIYTTRQLLQLFDRAYGDFVPSLTSWRDKNGGYVDPFRPRIQTFRSTEDVLTDRAHHLARVRKLFENLDVFIFTLGLTEAWEHTADHAVLPLAPGVAGGEWDPGQYTFHNYSVQEVAQDLIAFVDRLRSVNPSCRIVLTVSPVPLAATYERRHVLVSTCVSKATLRLAAENCVAARDAVFYFPSYEIITGPHSGNHYFDDDLRSVTKAGVDHVMRIFFAHFCGQRSQQLTPATLRSLAAEMESVKDVVCDEEALVTDNLR